MMVHRHSSAPRAAWCGLGRNEELTLHTYSSCEAIREIRQRRKSERLLSQSASASTAFLFVKRDRQVSSRTPCLASLCSIGWISSATNAALLLDPVVQLPE